MGFYPKLQLTKRHEIYLVFVMVRRIPMFLKQKLPIKFCGQAWQVIRKMSQRGQKMALIRRCV